MKIRNIVAMTASLAVLVGMFVGMTQTVYAQGLAAGKRGGGAAKRETPLIAALKALDLTETQKNQIQEISKKYRAERKDLVKGDEPTGATGDRPKLTPEDRTKITDMEAKQIAEVKAILTPEQATKFQTALDAAKAERGNGGPLGTMMEKLALTEEQKTKVAPILKDAGEALMKLREDTTMERRAKGAKMMEIWNDTKSKIRPILTPDQQKTLDEMQSLRGGGKRGGNRPGAK